MNQFSYIHSGKTHTNVSREYMNNIGMTTEAIDSTLQQKEYEEGQNIKYRAEAYKKESDPLYIEWQFELESANPEQATYKQRWLDKVTEIKSRYPIPANH